MRIALAQLNPTVGDIAGNTEKVLRTLSAARAERVDLVVFPELVLVGYPPRDLLLKPRFVAENLQALQRVAESCRGLTALVGCIQPTGRATGRPLHNAVAVCRDGRIAGVHFKTLLPTYDVFDEDRYFEPGENRSVERVRDAAGNEWPFGVSICEDLWNIRDRSTQRVYRIDPIADLVREGARFIVNASASPYVVDKEDVRVSLFCQQAERFNVPVLVVNQVGGNDDLIFDGASAVFMPRRGLVARARAFQEDLLVLDLNGDPGAARSEPYPDRLESIHDALVLGTRDYVRKCGFKGVVLGLSGGIDSALTAVIAAEALGREAVHGVAMPSRFNVAQSATDARELAANLGIDCQELPIEGVHRAFETLLAGALTGREPDTTEENVQARVRGTLLMALSNRFGWLLLTTGNKSELAVGYCTLYGDMCGGLAVISDVPKTTVYALARWINDRAGRPLIPARTIERAPTAELRPNQTDQDTLPSYEVLDDILKRYVEDLQSADEIIAAGFDAAVVRDVVRRVDTNEYKRKQAAIGLKVTSRAFGSGRRMPIAARYNP